jgi:hypothetical protein
MFHHEGQQMGAPVGLHFTAVQKQLGLKLDSSKGPGEFYIGISRLDPRLQVVMPAHPK